MPPIPTLVLDTNAWLDLLVFVDPATDGLSDAVAANNLRIAIDARASDELARVLRYGVLKLDESTIVGCIAKVARMATMVDTPPLSLPQCRDPDDQMFLEIAVATGARALLTRDAELLRMARRMQRDHGLAIVEPAGWRDALAAPA